MFASRLTTSNGKYIIENFNNDSGLIHRLNAITGRLVGSFSPRVTEIKVNSMCAESYDMFFPDTELYDGLRKITEDNGLQVVTPSAVTEQLEKDYPFWWDIAHLTPYGHKVMAGLLLPATEQMVESVLSDRTPNT